MNPQSPAEVPFACCGLCLVPSRVGAHFNKVYWSACKMRAAATTTTTQSRPHKTLWLGHMMLAGFALIFWVRRLAAWGLKQV